MLEKSVINGEESGKEKVDYINIFEKPTSECEFENNNTTVHNYLKKNQNSSDKSSRAYVKLTESQTKLLKKFILEVLYMIFTN